MFYIVTLVQLSSPQIYFSNQNASAQPLSSILVSPPVKIILQVVYNSLEFATHALSIDFQLLGLPGVGVLHRYCVLFLQSTENILMFLLQMIDSDCVILIESFDTFLVLCAEGSLY